MMLSAGTFNYVGYLLTLFMNPNYGVTLRVGDVACWGCNYMWLNQLCWWCRYLVILFVGMFSCIGYSLTLLMNFNYVGSAA